jgi:hypothetical protein
MEALTSELLHVSPKCTATVIHIPRKQELSPPLLLGIEESRAVATVLTSGRGRVLRILAHLPVVNVMHFILSTVQPSAAV